MKWLRSLMVVVAILAMPSPAAAADVWIPPNCYRDIMIIPLWKAEGSVSPHETGFTWFGFTVRADGCIFTGASVVFRTVHLTTDDDDLVAEDSRGIAWNANDMAPRTVYVKVLKDYDVEPDERFALKTVCGLSTGIREGVSSIGTVLNDDGDTPSSEPVQYNYHCKQ